MPPQHSKGRVSAHVRHLKRCGATEALISDFLELVEIDNQIASEPDRSLEALDRLLLDSCRKFNFAVPFDSEQGKAWFRPAQINSERPDHRDDVWGSGADFNPNEEQAYRRGYHQGFAEALRLAKTENTKALGTELGAISKWRFSRVWYGATRPGTVEPFGMKVALRSSLPARLRWQVLERDGRRCVVCGASASDGATLHVDHIVSVYNGGTNNLENLQTLCEPCNLGKWKH